MFRRLLAALAAVLFSVSAFDAAHAGARGEVCAGPGYTYAGVTGEAAASGVAATVTMLSPPRVRAGHVGAWVGVGGKGLGANGTDAWIQTGLSGFADGRTEAYYEIAVGASVRYVRVEAVAPGERHRVAVLELAGRPSWWRAVVDGRPVGSPVLLPGSHGAWAPVATAESWIGDGSACNAYAYRFGDVAVRPSEGELWQQLVPRRRFEDPGYRFQPARAGGFVARAVASAA